MKRRSSTKRRRPEPVFFIDRNLGSLFAAHLRLHGFRVEPHDDHFPPDAEDVEWLSFVGERGWVAVTQDHLRESPEEQVALMSCGAQVFVLKGKARHEDLAALFVRKRKRVLELISSSDEPFMASVSVATGEITLVILAEFLNAQARRRR